MPADVCRSPGRGIPTRACSLMSGPEQSIAPEAAAVLDLNVSTGSPCTAMARESKNRVTVNITVCQEATALSLLESGWPWQFAA